MAMMEHALRPETIIDRVDAARDDLVDLTCALVRIPTVNPPGDAYGPCARLIAERMRRRGFDTTIIRADGAPGDSDRYPRLNVVARLDSGRPGPCVHFNGHIDVVEAGLGWSFDPFAATVRDGRIYGRGTCDMKGGLAAAIIAVEAIQDSGIPWCGVLEISGTADEESGGFGGVAHLATLGLFSTPRVDHVIIPEPLDPDRICLGHRGVWWAEVETLGRIAHGSMPFLGTNAIRHMGAVLGRIEQDLLPRLAARTTRMPVVPVSARAATLNINSIHGGQAEPGDSLPSPCVADSCRLVLDRRVLVEETIADARAEVMDLLDGLARTDPEFRYRIRDLMTVEPVMTDPGAPVVKALEGSIARVFGRPATHIASPGSYDQKHIRRIGGLHDCAAYGPGRLELAHQPDEWVGIDDLVQSAKVMAMAALTLLGVQSGG